MESASPSKKKYKKRKKQSNLQHNGEIKAIVKPECFDGMSNWLQFQKILDKTKKELPKRFSRDQDTRPSKKRRLLYSKTDMLTASQKKNISTDKSNGNLKPASNACTRPITRVSENDQNTNPGYSSRSLPKVVSLDCEMVGVGPEGKDSIVARVSIVNSQGHCIYDEYVKPTEKVTDFRTKISGIRPSDLKKGKDLFEVQKDVAEIIEGKKVVGHGVNHDFKVLFLSHPRKLIRDTSKYKPFREVSGGNTPSLKKLTSVLLGYEIQNGEHSSIEDAKAAMELYLNNRKAWEREIKGKRKKKTQT